MSEYIHHGKKEIEVANLGETTALLPKPNPKKKEKKKEESVSECPLGSARQRLFLHYYL